MTCGHLLYRELPLSRGWVYSHHSPLDDAKPSRSRHVDTQQGKSSDKGVSVDCFPKVEASEHLFGWKRPLRSTPTTNSALSSHHWTMPLCAISAWLLKLFRDDESTTSLGSLLQDSTTLWGKKLFFVLNLNLPWHNRKLFPLALSLVTFRVLQRGERSFRVQRQRATCRF